MRWAELVNVFAILGVGDAIVMLCAMILIGMELWKEHVEKKKHAYRIAHRFDKLPTAPCYCKDCREWSKGEGLDSGNCNRYKYPSPDSGFCWRASPRSADSEDDI